MQKLFVLVIGLSVITLRTQAQTIDAARLARMSPAELEAWKKGMLQQASSKAKRLAAQYNVKLDETMLPDFEAKAPIKDLQRLELLRGPVRSMTQLTADLRKTERQLQQLTPPAVIAQVKTMSEKQSGDELQGSAIGQWMSDNPVQALLLSMASAQKSPDRILPWNNLAAFYNMTGMEHKAVPILQQLLQRAPGNPMLLNNLGQAYLGLGDIGKAKDYLRQCLAVDEFHPEANRSMAMIAAFDRQYDEAMSYYEKELQIAMRRSSIAQIKKMGRTVDLAAIRNRRKDIPHRDLFTEIGLEKFHIPDLPRSSEETAKWRSERNALLKSISREFAFWSQVGNLSDKERRQDGQQTPGLYADLADKLLSDHGDEYAPLLGLIGKADTAALGGMTRDYYKKLNEALCPTAPLDPQRGAELALAYRKKCCDLHRPIVDAYMAQHNDYIENRLTLTIANWKSYINGCIDIVSIAPSNAAKKSIYKIVADYFGFLFTALSTAVADEAPPAECMVNLTTEEADAIIAAKHEFELDCPEWLKVKFEAMAVTLQADCSKFSIIGGEGILAGVEKNFKKGTLTISAGVGEQANFKGLVQANMSLMGYVSFDNDNNFSDFGVKGTSVVGTSIGGLNGSAQLGVHAGFNAAVNGKGILKNLVNLSTQ
ncbi:MAG: tetratricopeptide repeat protein [Bacteroidetes bacterium]|nr:tetratricopeptide repeat protein [Bacteroidota bacterium]